MPIENVICCQVLKENLKINFVCEDSKKYTLQYLVTLFKVDGLFLILFLCRYFKTELVKFSYQWGNNK